MVHLDCPELLDLVAIHHQYLEELFREGVGVLLVQETQETQEI